MLIRLSTSGQAAAPALDAAPSARMSAGALSSRLPSRRRSSVLFFPSLLCTKPAFCQPGLLLHAAPPGASARPARHALMTQAGTGRRRRSSSTQMQGRPHTPKQVGGPSTCVKAADDFHDRRTRQLAGSGDWFDFQPPQTRCSSMKEFAHTLSDGVSGPMPGSGSMVSYGEHCRFCTAISQPRYEQTHSRLREHRRAAGAQ